MSGQADALLLQLAHAAGLQTAWRDVHGAVRRVGPETLRAVLASMGLECRSPAQCADSLELLHMQDDSAERTGLAIVRAGAPLVVRARGSLHYRMQLEGGGRVLGTARDVGRGRALIPALRQPGYHRLEMGGQQCTVAVIPPRAPAVTALLRRAAVSQPRALVLGAQVYALQRLSAAGGSASNIVLPGWEAGGDFSLLGKLAAAAAQQGAAALAISPVHAMFTADAGRYSPYAPSSRLFLNAMYADPAAVFDAEFLQPPHSRQVLPYVDADGCLDWPTIQEQRLSQLRRIFDRFESLQPARWSDEFFEFRRQGGEALSAHACYEALHAHFAPALGPQHGWRDWPTEYHHPGSRKVREFAETHERELRFHAFLQWLAARSLAEAQAQATAVMPIGLIADMAVGTDPRGSHAWSRQEQVMTGVTVGAPPDLFQPRGQDWGLTAFSPWGLRRNGYAGFIETLRAVLAHAGGLRVDHVIGMARMWLVPEGAAASEGVYIGYPLDDLMDLLALEAWRHDALVVGENLGTVPEGFDAAMERRGFLGMSVLWFEREAGSPPRFRRPADWPVNTMAMATTHDLPTLRGWWVGRDIEWRERHGEYSPEHAEQQRHVREQEKQGLWSALCDEGLAEPNEPLPQEAPVAAMLAYVAGTPAVLLSVALEDLLGEQEQVNLPGGAGGELAAAHPNWRRTLAQPVEALLQHGDAPLLLSVLRKARGVGEPVGRRE